MKIPTYRQSGLQFIDPDQLTGILTFIAVTIATGVVSDTLMLTLIALLDVPTKGRGTTSDHILHGFTLNSTWVVYL
jgi:hypothetical protein